MDARLWDLADALAIELHACVEACAERGCCCEGARDALSRYLDYAWTRSPSLAALTELDDEKNNERCPRCAAEITSIAFRARPLVGRWRPSWRKRRGRR